MIENFSYVNSKENKVKIQLTSDRGKSIYYPEDKNIFFDIYNSDDLGAQWEVLGENIQLLKKGEIIKAYPSVDLKYVIAIEDNSYLNVYNEYGIMLRNVQLPLLVSNLSKQYYKNIKYPDLMSFNDVGWFKKNDITYNVITIGFAMYWYEVRILDPTTGDFGECVSGGRV